MCTYVSWLTVKELQRNFFWIPIDLITDLSLKIMTVTHFSQEVSAEIAQIRT